jgi:hypothetical protein
MPTTFDPAAKNAFVDLTNNDLTATNNGGGAAEGNVLSTEFKASGKWYAEFFIDNDNLIEVGIGQSGTTLVTGEPLGSDAVSYGYGPGFKAHNGVPSGYGDTYITGDTIGVAMDLDAGTLRFLKNGVDQGEAFSSISGSYCFAATVGDESGSTTVNFGAASFLSLPEGYSGIDEPAFTPIVLIAPAPRVVTGTDGIEAVAPLPVLVSSGYSVLITADLITRPPRLASSVISGEVITVEARAARPILVAVLDNPTIITSSLVAPSPQLLATILAGTIGSAELVALAPIMAATGYPAYTITFGGVAPSPYLSASIYAVLAANYRTWVINARKGAITEYDSWQFNSFALFNGQILAAGAGGIVSLGTQDKDNTTAITARVRTGQNAFGSAFHKRIPRIYLGHESSGDLLFRTITTEGGERTYLLPWNNISGVQQRRIPVGKGPRSRYWQLEIENKNGADFAVDDILVYPVTLRRRVQ